MSQELYNEYVAKVNDVQAFQKKHSRAIAEAAFDAALKAVPEAEIIVVQGYTPGFNDGDPCTFSLNVIAADVLDYIDTDELELDIIGGKTAEDFETEEEWNDYACEAKEQINSNVDWKKDSIVSEFFSPIEDLMEYEFGEYGFQVIAHRNAEGGIELYESEYDCGY